VLGHRGRRLAHLGGQFVDRQLAADQRPQDPHPGAVGQHPEALDDQVDLVVRQRSPTRLAICGHTQIADDGRRRN
jgi:hypothetical protein